jgi:hypothetical protein
LAAKSPLIPKGNFEFQNFWDREPMPDLFLRKVDHPQARDSHRVILKIDETEFEIGSIGVTFHTSTEPVWSCASIR